MLNRFNDFVTGVSLCHKHIQKIKSSEMTKLGLKGNHAMCLFHLSHNPVGLTVSKLSELCAEDKAAISRSLSLLHEKGYIKDRDKKYRDVIHLTEEGKKVSAQLDEIISSWVEEIGKDLTDEERSGFYKVLFTVEKSLRSGVMELNK